MEKKKLTPVNYTDPKFNDIQNLSTKYLWKFVDNIDKPKLVLAHNCYLNRNTQPDIFLLKDEELVFTIDVKVAIADSEAMIRALTKLADTVINSKSKIKTQGYLISVGWNLPFSVERVQDAFDKFSIAECHIVGPRGGTLDRKMGQLGSKLMSLEACLTRISEAL